MHTDEAKCNTHGLMRSASSGKPWASMPGKPKVVDGLGYGKANGGTESSKSEATPMGAPRFSSAPPCGNNPIYVPRGSVATPVYKRNNDYWPVLHICKGGPQHT